MRSLAFISTLLLMLLLPAAPGRADADWSWPVRGQVLTKFKNGDDPYAAGQHRGVDIAADVGTPVVAATAGTVVFAGVVGSSGLVVSERTDDGRYELSYLHLSAASVRRGDSVDRGDRLGAAGVSGTRSVEQPHLHFGVREAGDRHAYLDPLGFLAPQPPAEAPQPAPAPVPVREPAPAAPAGVPVSAPVPVAPPVPAIPGPALHPAPRAAHRTAPRVALHGAPVPAPVAGHISETPHHVSPHSHTRAARTPAPIAANGPAGAASRGHLPAPARHVRGATHEGIDVGWLAACAGLVLAAALLAAPRGDGRGRPSARAAFRLLTRAASRA